MMSSPAAMLALFPGAGLRRRRVHEATGFAARSFAAMAAGACGGDCLWIRQGRSREALNPYGLAIFLDPSRIVLVEADRPLDVLWCAEEALRLGAAPLVIAEPGTAIDLTASRRLQLAAETGGGIGLCLVSPPPAANAAETRWTCDPAPADAAAGHLENPDSTRWRLSLIKNKRGTLGNWEIGWDAASRRIIVVSKAADRPAGPARGSGGGGSAGRRGDREERPQTCCS